SASGAVAGEETMVGAVVVGDADFSATVSESRPTAVASWRTISFLVGRCLNQILPSAIFAATEMRTSQSGIFMLILSAIFCLAPSHRCSDTLWPGALPASRSTYFQSRSGLP